jgi:hypothetical protein
VRFDVGHEVASNLAAAVRQADEQQEPWRFDRPGGADGRAAPLAPTLVVLDIN